MKRTDLRFQTILAALLLLFELAVLFLPVFSGHTALELVRLQWQNGGTVLRLGIVLLLLLCPAISCGLLWQIHTLAAKAEGNDIPPVSANTSTDVTPVCGTLVFLSGALQGKSFPLPAYENILLGRSSQSCQIVVNASDISRRHVCICYHATRHTFVITDYSANGTYTADGERLITNTSLEVTDGSTFYLGNRQNAFQLLADWEV